MYPVSAFLRKFAYVLSESPYVAATAAMGGYSSATYAVSEEPGETVMA